MSEINEQRPDPMRANENEDGALNLQLYFHRPFPDGSVPVPPFEFEGIVLTTSEVAPPGSTFRT